VRNDNDPLAWVTYVYDENSHTLIHVNASGEGGLDEFRESFSEKERMYGFLRVIDIVDNHETVKFVFVAWQGDKVSVVKKARMATHKGSIQKFIGQSHLAIDASEKSDLSDSVVFGRISDNSGSGSRVINPNEQRGQPRQIASPVQQNNNNQNNNGIEIRHVEQVQYAQSVQQQAPKPVVARSQPSGASAHPSVPRGSAGDFSLSDEVELNAAIKRVRADQDPADWVLFGYEGGRGTNSNVLVLDGVGEGGIEALKQHLFSDSVNYGIVRVNDVVDNHVTVKFVLIQWVGEGVRIMRKARIPTHKGAFLAFIGQYHTDIVASTLDELTYESIMKKVQDASGTAIHIKNLN
jgi:hypothetical protein